MRVHRALTASCLAVGVGWSLSSPAAATAIHGFHNPISVLPSGVQVDFESIVPGAYTVFTEGNVTFESLAPTFMAVTNAYQGQYNNTGQSLQNTYSPVGFTEIHFIFGTPVGAFAFNFGASNDPWQLTAYDAANNVLDTLTIAPTLSSNAGHFFGLATNLPNIASARLVADPPSAPFNDYVFIDDFTWSPVSTVPLPGALPLMASALVGLGLFGRKRLR